MNYQNTIYSVITFTLFIGLAITYSTAGMAVAEENGLLENIQLVMLVVALMSAVFITKQATNKSLRYIGVGFILLTIGFFVREFDVRGTDAPSWLIWIGSPDGSLIITLAMFIPYIIYSVINLRFAWSAAMQLLNTYHFARLMLVLFFLMLGGAYDREWIQSVHGMFYEEFYETIAWWFYAWSLFKLTPAQMQRDNAFYARPPSHAKLDVRD